jgi:imidazolonepropionase-like amidohydrolase
MATAFQTGVVASVLAFCGSAWAATSGGGNALLVKNVTLISPERPEPLAHADVLIEGGRIARIGSDLPVGKARRIEGTGRFLVPGLIDSHVHVAHLVGLDDDAAEAHPELLTAYRRQLPRSYLEFGFTTLIDLDFDPRTRSWFDAAPAHPRLYSCGPGVRIAGGYPSLNLAKDVSPERAPNLVFEAAQSERWPATLKPEDYTAERAAERAAAAQAICTKVFVESGFGVFTWPTPRPETLSALHQASVRRHIPMIVHANSIDAWHAALNGGAEIIAHGLWQWPGDRGNATPPESAHSVIGEAARRGTFVQPTLRVLYGEEALFDPAIVADPRYAQAMPRVLITYLHSAEAEGARRTTAEAYLKVEPDVAKLLPAYEARVSTTLRLLYAANANLILGSDTPAGEGVEGVGNPPGLNGYLELVLWEKAGIPPARILRAATLDNATAFRLDKELGSIEVGKRADLLLLSADPLKRVKAYEAIDTVILNGRVLQVAELRPDQ